MIKKAKSLIYDTIETIIITALVFVFVSLFIGKLLEIDGRSMEPTLSHGEKILSERVSMSLNPLEFKDVVVFQHPLQNKLLIKRIIGVPGDKIKIENGVVYRNGTPLSETYTKDDSTGNGPYFKPGVEITVEEDNYILLGDNRDVSIDSRIIGQISEKEIFGRARFVYFPIDQMRSIK
jgi:signal peptidase I